jgi:hypothetical protein
MAGRKKRNDMRQSRFDKHRDSLRLGTLVKTLCNIGSHFVGPIESAEAAASRRNDSWSSVRKTDNWSCQLAQRLVKTGGRVVKQCPVLLVSVGAEPSGAALRGDGRKDPASPALRG